MSFLQRFFWRKHRLERERDYLLRWLGGFNAELTGLSADTLSREAFGVGGEHRPPLNLGDLGRCERAYAAMPRHLQRRVRKRLELWQRQVVETERLRSRMRER